jgi:hypothetical protein
MHRVCLIPVLALAWVACSSPDMTPGPGGTADAPSASSCQVTLSGAVTGTFTCLITLAYTPQNDRTSFGFMVQMPAPLQMINASATRSGTPAATQTWTHSDATGTGTFYVQPAGTSGQSWIASSGTATPQGSYSITFKPGAAMTYPQITNYPAPTGTFSATLLPGAGTTTTGMVMMTATF